MEEMMIREDTKTMTKTSLRLEAGTDKGERRQAKAVNRLLEALDNTATSLAEKLSQREPCARLLYTVRCQTDGEVLTLSVTLVHRRRGAPSQHKSIRYRFFEGCLLEEEVGY